MRRILISGLTLVFLILVFLFSYSKAPAKEVKEAKKEYAGVEACQMCHQNVYDNLTKTAMGILFVKHPRDAKERLGCETCHGPGNEHVASSGSEFGSLVRFRQGTPVPVYVRNEVCLKCHEKKQRLFWQGSPHETNGYACTECHTVHTGPGMETRNQLVRLNVTDTCSPCHKKQVGEEMRFSHHPIREGKVSCVSCHNPHGTTSPKLVKGLSNRELCFTCHAEKRGPFLFQHPPVLEDCAICHLPHGSAYPGLLKAPPIRLCRECHITFHAVNFNQAAPGKGPRLNQMMGGACVNCHVSIHGSNNSGGQLLFH
ncbi:MAG TPA: DmsE family decaheme c-type cytochrome [Deltaproteobacteria bacterium]|nr:DmsE family decaheme c-type cytochrome [Deltaproteobacteria bacterium]